MWDGAMFNETALGPKGMFWDGAVNIPNEIPGAQPGAFGEFALNLTDTVGDIGCGRFNSVYMKTRSSHSITSELFDRTPPLALAPVVPPPDLSKAKATGNAFAAHVADTQHDALHAAIDVTLPNGVNPAGGVASSQSGPGSNSQSDAVVTVNQPGLIRAQVLSASSASTVTAKPAAAINAAIAEAADVDILDGLVSAGTVRAVAEAAASGTNSSFSASGSAFQNLLIDLDGAAGPLPPVAHNNVNPNTTIELPAAIFGGGSVIKLFERVGSTSTPAPGNTPGLFTADLSVRMINVHITDHDPLMLGNQTVDVVVASAVSHAEFEQIVLCPPQRVSGHAFIVKESTNPALTPALVGFVDIPANGGFDQQNLEQLIVPADGSVLTSGVSVSESFGVLLAEGTTASSFAETSGACVLSAGGLCQVSATVIRSQSNSTADPTGALSNAGGTQLLQATVLGSDVCTTLGLDATCTPPPNTTIPLAGVGFVVLNEQVCDNNGTLANGCADGTDAGHAGLTVRAIRIVVTVPSNPLGLALGTQIIVSEAHSDAEFKTR
jgi:hypothetical protein